MSELKAYTYDDMLDGAADVDVEYYPKSEADKVIAELKCLVNGLQNRSGLWHYNAVEEHKKFVQADKVIAEQKSEIERLEILCANYRHDCDNLAISNEQVKKAARTLLKKMNHNKRKRCLAMAKLCQWKMGVFIYKEEKSNFYQRWYKRWSMLAEKLKEAK